ncbi:MAG TPA: hypothetical protein VGB18_09145 [Candidatus Thermoplasmatota archaeon]
MTSPVRIEENHKATLARLRHEVALASGRQPSQQEVLGQTIEFALRHRDQFLRESTWKPLPEKDIQALLGRAQPLGRWGSEDIDDIVYGSSR